MKIGGTPFENLGRVSWLTSLGGHGPLDRKTIYRMDAFGGHSMAETYTQHCKDWKIFVFTGNFPLARRLRPPIRRRIDLFNGKIPCRLLEFEGD